MSTPTVPDATTEVKLCATPGCEDRTIAGSLYCAEHMFDENNDLPVPPKPPAPPTVDELFKKLADLHGLRLLSNTQTEAIAKERAKFDEATKPMFEVRSDFDAKKTRLEAEIRQMAVAIYEADPSIGKKGLPGVGIEEKPVTEMRYDEADVLFWCRQHGMCLLIDKPEFERMVRAAPNQFRFEGEPLVRIETVKTLGAAIATDLGKALAKAQVG